MFIGLGNGEESLDRQHKYIILLRSNTNMKLVEEIFA